jgi:hypothetical protein
MRRDFDTIAARNANLMKMNEALQKRNVLTPLPSGRDGGGTPLKTSETISFLFGFPSPNPSRREGDCGVLFSKERFLEV